ncbi:MAG: C1 family peptidase [Chloroflexi bacterium]|nr:C1 family peptidase [Chloroflexota bacterium]
MPVQVPPPFKNAAPLTRAPELNSAHIGALKSYWLISIQDILAWAEVPGGREHLRTLLQFPEAKLDELLRRLAAMVSLRGPEAAREEEAMRADYQSGALEPPPTERDEKKYVRIPLAEELPSFVNYVEQLPPARNQGGRSTCVAHAAAAVREQLEIAAGLAHPREFDLSEQLIYWWCKQKDNLPQVSGTYPHLGMACLAELGTAPEADWPYNARPRLGDEAQGPPPPAALADAWRYRVKRILPLHPNKIEDIKAALASGKAVMISIPIFLSWYQNRVTRRYGKINMPLPDEHPEGAHAIVVVGYVDDDEAPGGGYFLIRNSWSPWGFDSALASGHGVIPYAFIEKHNQVAITAERAPVADVYLRAHDSDTGDLPRSIDRYNSPDIWVRQSRDNEEGHQAALAHTNNWIYVRAWNRGPAVARQVKADVFVTRATTSLFPQNWQHLGEVTFSDIEPGDSQLAELAWQPEASGPYAFFVRLHSPDDPVTYPWAVANDNNLAQKNLVHVRVRPGESATVAFPLLATPDEQTAMVLEVDRKQFQRGRVHLDYQGTAQRHNATHLRDDEAQWLSLAQSATVSQEVKLTITADEDATAKDSANIIVRQRYGDWFVGRMIVAIQIEA